MKKMEKNRSKRKLEEKQRNKKKMLNPEGLT